MPPNRTLATMQIIWSQGVTVYITYHFCCNADRNDKVEPLVIGLLKKPKPFGRHPALYYGFNYTTNAKAWMTGAIIGEWLTHLNS